MKKLILTIMGVVAILLSFNVNAKMSEGDYVDKICKGSIEYTLDNKTRVDCQLANESQEYDWQNKWYECFGQSLYYGMKTGNSNGCVLIAKNNKWQKYTDRALETIKYYNLPIKLYIVKPNEFSTTLLYDPNKPATQLLGGDRYDDEGNCYKSGVLGKVPCDKPSPTNCDVGVGCSYFTPL
jgi:hypothetical protein